ncbi:hypothetical protein RZS28_00120 [Methylocapsa polymorpha]|uniref:Uncharacterized protein n=1 Tax=Methylocapsa polymorpha TaxID=3080828 RepID=A0ABZ0HT86_9HYPH|nr:hypothetical protein RZS28_00120 [Methylocapsa sp. RX1]
MAAFESVFDLGGIRETVPFLLDLGFYLFPVHAHPPVAEGDIPLRLELPMSMGGLWFLARLGSAPAHP